MTKTKSTKASTAEVSTEEVAERLGDLARTLPPNPKKALVAAYMEVARVVGVDKAKRLLAEKHGTDDPETLKVSQLMDAIDDLYGAQ